jgi:hypothetical protein
VLRSFFKIGPGEYGAGDVFIGVRVPELRQVCRDCRGASLDAIQSLLRSRIHEERLLALLMLVNAFRSGHEVDRRGIFKFYLANTALINNWDLVDSQRPTSSAHGCAIATGPRCGNLRARHHCGSGGLRRRDTALHQAR